VNPRWNASCFGTGWQWKSANCRSVRARQGIVES
jgi:hypothetical protein